MNFQGRGVGLGEGKSEADRPVKDRAFFRFRVITERVEVHLMAEDSTDPGPGDGRVPDLYDVGSGGVHRLECRFSMADRDDRR